MAKNFDFIVNSNGNSALTFSYCVIATEFNNVEHEGASLKLELYMKPSNVDLMNTGSYLMYGMKVNGSNGEFFSDGPTPFEEDNEYKDFQPRLSSSSYTKLCEYTYSFTYEENCTVTFQPIAWFNRAGDKGQYRNATNYGEDGAQYTSRPIPVISTDLIESGSSARYVNKSFSLDLTSYDPIIPETSLPDFDLKFDYVTASGENEFVAQFLNNRVGTTTHANAPIEAIGNLNKDVQLKVRGNSPYVVVSARDITNMEEIDIDIDLNRHMGLVIRTRYSDSSMWETYFVNKLLFGTWGDEGGYKRYIRVGADGADQALTLALNDDGSVRIVNVSKRDLKIEVSCY